MLFPVVAIGSSAGGLEAYSKIIKNLPSDTGMAYVIIQHLDPIHKSFLNEIVSRETDMKVSDLRSGITPKPDNIYIIQPNSTVTFIRGKFHCIPRENKLHKPIDIFMSSLAKDNSHNVIGVLLSGADSDGLIGMKDIKANGGITFAQDKKTSKFPEMPQKAISAGIIDNVCTPLEIAEEIAKISNKTISDPSKSSLQEHNLQMQESEIKKIYKLIHLNNGIDFKDYKITTFRRRLVRRMDIQKINKISDYVQYLKKHSEELDSLCGDVLISVTSFFRDPEMYNTLSKKVFPEIFKNKDSNNPLRVWVSGCSSGQEAYSLAISINEFREKNNLKIPVQIFSTDLSDSGIAKARAGIYTSDLVKNVPAELLKKYFEKHNEVYRINKKIRSMCIFARQNLIQDPPFSKLDLISCRNVLIYLGKVLQDNIMPLFHFSLSPKGFLVLGSSETIGQFSNLFEQVDKKNKIFSKKNVPARIQFNLKNIRPVAVLHDIKRDQESKESRILSEEESFNSADTIILNKYAPPSILVTKDLEVVQFRGKANSYFRIPQGKPTTDLLKITNDELKVELNLLVRKCIKNNTLVRKNEIEISYLGEKKAINIIVIPMEGFSVYQKLYLIIFEDNFKLITSASEIRKGSRNGVLKIDSEKVILLKKELLISNENLQSYIEELQSANEEIQSSNEELQSTNEELETAKEELQSTNEELSTVNDELLNRNTELSGTNNDLNNLLSSINIPVILLDNNLKIRRFTNMAGKLLNLIPGDIGRKLTDININISISNLKKLILEVRKTPTTLEKLVKDRRNYWYYMRIRPYMTVEKKIDGVILAFVDVTDLKRSMYDLEKLNLDIVSSNNKLEDEIKVRKNIEVSLRDLSKQLVRSQEIEKKRLSRDLHDSVNQILSIVKMKLHSTESLAKKESNKVVIKDISDARKLLERAINEVRNISKNLRPHAIDDLGLKVALQSIIEEFTKRVKIKVHFKASILSTIVSKETELNAYRIIQEALHNIEKHSGARNVKIGLKMNKTELQVVVIDDGHGFTITDQNILHRKMHKYGLMGMRERAESLGGKFEIISNKGKGTKIFAALPVHIIQT